MSRRTNTLVRLAVSASVAWAVLPLAPAAAVAPPSPSGGVALTWAPTYMSNDHGYSRTEAEAVARKFDIVAGMPIAFQDHVSAMRSANSDLTLLSYANATLAEPTSTSGFPESYFAHDSYGRRIKAPDFGTYLMESSNAGWRSKATAQCRERAARADYDGCLVDMLTLGIYSKGYVTGTPVKPWNGQPYTQAEYRDQMLALGQQYEKDNPGLVHSGNAVENSYRFWQAPVPSRPLAHGLPSVQMEDFLRGAHNSPTAFPSTTDWVRNVDVVRDLEAKGVVGLYTTKVWSGATAAQVAQWQKYSMATFLMGAGGKSYFAFTSARTKAGSIGANLPYSMPKQIGWPTGPMTAVNGGAYLRPFTGGKTVVNPTASQVTVDLGAQHELLSGGTTRWVTLPPHSGEIALAAGDSAAPTGSFDEFSSLESGSPLVISGQASDDTAVRAAGVAVRNEATGQWLRSDGSWGAYQVLWGALAQSGAARTTWRRSVDVAPGKYGLSLVVEDTAGKLNATPRPWKVVSVL